MHHNDALESVSSILMAIIMHRSHKSHVNCVTPKKVAVAPLHASDSHGDFSEVFIGDVLEAKREAELSLGKCFDDVDDLIADLLEGSEFGKKDG